MTETERLEVGERLEGKKDSACALCTLRLISARDRYYVALGYFGNPSLVNLICTFLDLTLNHPRTA